jgi:hypothetical protein
MKFDLPFNLDTILAMAGQTMVLCENKRNEVLFRPFWTFPVKSGGDLDRGYFEVVDGVLRLMDKQGLFCEFQGVESRNNVVFATGTAAQTVSRDGFDRITMHERSPLSQSLNFGICISSHVSYEKSTLPLLLDSIRKAKFDMAKVVAVVGGFKGSKTEVIEGATILYQEDNGQGFGGLTGASKNCDYWLLLHDTCEAERNFIDSAVSVDVGLSPDVIRLRGDREDWTGFYKTEFIERILDDVKAKSIPTTEAIKNMAKVVMTLPGKVVEVGVKDVYGTGNKRMIEKLSVGIRKFRGITGRRTP